MRTPPPFHTLPPLPPTYLPARSPCAPLPRPCPRHTAPTAHPPCAPRPPSTPFRPYRPYHPPICLPELSEESGGWPFGVGVFCGVAVAVGLLSGVFVGLPSGGGASAFLPVCGAWRGLVGVLGGRLGSGFFVGWPWRWGCCRGFLWGWPFGGGVFCGVGRLESGSGGWAWCFLPACGAWRGLVGVLGGCFGWPFGVGG